MHKGFRISSYFRYCRDGAGACACTRARARVPTPRRFLRVAYTSRTRFLHGDTRGTITMGRWLIIQGCNYSTIETNRPYTVVGKEQNHETGDENPLWRKEGGVYICLEDCPFPSPLRRGRFSNIIEISFSCFSQSSRWSSRSSCKRSQMRRIPARVIQSDAKRSRLEFGIPGSWDKWEGTEFSVACVLGQERRSKDSVAPRRLKKSLHSSFPNRESNSSLLSG